MPEIDTRIDDVQGFISELEARLSANPDDFAAKLALSSWRAHLSELRLRAGIESAQAHRELVELRLIGNRVRNGSIPLTPLSKVAGAFAKAINEAVLRLKYGVASAADKAEKLLAIERLTDLRLAGIGEGSTRLFVTGKMAEDLTGQALLNDVMRTLFGVLNANDPESFYDMTHALGDASSKAVEQLMDALEKYEFAAELSWTASAGQLYRWEGRSDEIVRIRTLLENVSELAVVNEWILGSVSLISDNGRLEVRVAGEDRPRKVRYAKSKYDLVRSLAVGDIANFHLESSTMFDRAADKELHKFALVDIQLPNARRLQ
ncbi:hypothetical protein [Ralstonia pseudosolanacearum]|uniref:hypothetical protein n=1 Tax=Ralstonia pseudosolanacearum TaxID=1310165 RepID=UPI000DAECD9F|nr:hypothetical protein [Ralstonia pseudosolanacearum]RAA18463.1 hypothetical protein DOT79_04665 [Ralstonia pseudosolanacearum]